MAQSIPLTLSAEWHNEDTTNHTQQLPLWKRLLRPLSSWRGTIWAGFLLTCSTLVFNIALVIWALSKNSKDPFNGLYYLLDETCDNVSKASIAVHLAINLCSTLILGASNFCLQALTSPTRKDIDKAHKQGEWVSIGVFSLRNFRFISRQRTLVCLILALTSIPLALLYNSAIIDVLAANQWIGLAVYSNIFKDGPIVRGRNTSMAHCIDPNTWEARSPQCYGTIEYFNYLPFVSFSDRHGGFRNLTRLSIQDCVKTYSSDRMSRYGDMLFVANGTDNMNTLITGIGLWFDDRDFHTPWFPNLAGEAYNPPDELLIKNVRINHCLVVESENFCHLGLSVSTMIVVIICNAIKAFCLFYALSMISFKPLVTIGDAIDSFLSHADPYTKDQGSLSKSDVTQGLWSSQNSQIHCNGRTWAAQRRFFAQSVSVSRWVVLLIVGGAIWIASLRFLMWSKAYGGINFSPNSFGIVRRYNLWYDPALPREISIYAIISNTPHILVSCFYLLYNSNLTLMCLTEEYGSYTTKRRGLRVSEPRRYQRKSYFLSLPIRYSGPLLIITSILHWLISQALFPAYLLNYEEAGVLRKSYIPNPISTLGFSPAAALLSSIILGTLLLIVLPLFALRKYRPDFVIAVNCSAAISSATHSRGQFTGSNTDLGSQRLQYGIFADRHVEDADNGNSRIKRVGFSDRFVEELTEGDYYEAPDDTRRSKTSLSLHWPWAR